MDLNSITEAYMGDKKISMIYLGDKLIYSNSNLIGFWDFNVNNSTITGFSVTTFPAGTMTIDWGDGNEDTVNSGELINHTLTI